jgi:hypothetical protein
VTETHNWQETAMAALGLAFITTSSPATDYSGRRLMQHAMIGTARPGPRTDAEAVASPPGRWLGLE